MAGPGLPVNVDTANADDANDATVKAHQQHHDALHAIANGLDTTLVTAATSGALLEWAPASSSYVPVTASYYDQPTDLGFKSWSIDIRNLSASASAPTAGLVYLQRLRWPTFVASGSTLNHQLYTIQAGTGSTALANCFVGFYRADTGALIGSSATQASAWATTGIKEVAITTTADKPANVDMWAALLVGTQSTTTFCPARGPNAILGALLNGKGPLMFATANSGQTSLPATLSSIVASSLPYYAGLF